MTRMHFEKTGLVRYDAMQRAIIAAREVDEVKDIRDKAVALEKYAQQARNFEAERRAAQIRIMAETKAGALLKEQLPKAIPKGSKRDGVRGKVTNRSTDTTSYKTLDDLKINKDQSAAWQKLAENPKAVRAYLADEDSVPTTAGAVAAAVGKQPKPKPVPLPFTDEALWVWGRIGDLYRRQINPKKLISEFDDRQRADLALHLDAVIPQLQQLRKLL